MVQPYSKLHRYLESNGTVQFGSDTMTDYYSDDHSLGSCCFFCGSVVSINLDADVFIKNKAGFSPESLVDDLTSMEPVRCCNECNNKYLNYMECMTVISSNKNNHGFTRSIARNLDSYIRTSKLPNGISLFTSEGVHGEKCCFCKDTLLLHRGRITTIPIPVGSLDIIHGNAHACGKCSDYILENAYAKSGTKVYTFDACVEQDCGGYYPITQEEKRYRLNEDILGQCICPNCITWEYPYLLDEKKTKKIHCKHGFCLRMENVYQWLPDQGGDFYCPDCMEVTEEWSAIRDQESTSQTLIILGSTPELTIYLKVEKVEAPPFYGYGPAENVWKATVSQMTLTKRKLIKEFPLYRDHLEATIVGTEYGMKEYYRLIA